MANCKSCGREVPSSSFGGASELCPDCRRTSTASAATLSQPSRSPVESKTRWKLDQRFLSLTTVLVGINVAVFVLMTVTGVSPLSPTTQQLLKWGANWGPLSLGKQPWRLLTSNYVHIGIIHLFFNMWCLLNLGALAHRMFDRWTYLLVYTASGIAGSLASLYWHPTVVGAGASGAIFGLAGALIAALYLGKLPFPKEAVRSTMKSLLLFAGYNLFFGLRTGVDNAAHIGGLAGGFALGAFFSRNLTAPVEVRLRWRNYATIATVILVAVGLHAVRKQYGYLAQISSPAEYSGQFEKGINALKNDDFTMAIPAFQKVVQLNPDSPEANYLLGTAYLGANQPDPAIASFQRALRIKPNFADTEEALGTAYKAKGMDDEAQAAYAKAAHLRGK
jgi:membrane associated rhomboid family serine protease